MQGKYYPPRFNVKEFNCVYCGVYAKQIWNTLLQRGRDSEIEYCSCTHCGNDSFWFEEKMIIPEDAPVQFAHSDMPKECLTEYNEARSIVSKSPRAAAALVRLAIQKLMVVLGEKGKKIDNDIASLVSKGLAPEIQKALDYCRVVGNNGVHPGEIDLNDTPEMAHIMFDMINMIVEERISRPKKIEEMYQSLPKGALEAIEKRDNK